MALGSVFDINSTVESMEISIFKINNVNVSIDLSRLGRTNAKDKSVPDRDIQANDEVDPPSARLTILFENRVYNLLEPQRGREGVIERPKINFKLTVENDRLGHQSNSVVKWKGKPLTLGQDVVDGKKTFRVDQVSAYLHTTDGQTRSFELLLVALNDENNGSDLFALPFPTDTVQSKPAEFEVVVDGKVKNTVRYYLVDRLRRKSPVGDSI